MESHDSCASLAALGFVPKQIEHLQQLRAVYDEKRQEERRRLEFIRWLVATGRLTDGLPTASSLEKTRKGNLLYVSSSSTLA